MLFIPDPGFYPSRISNNNINKREEKIRCPNFFLKPKYHTIENYFIFEQVKKIIRANSLELHYTLALRNMGLGSGIRRKDLFQIPDPGVKKAPDPGSGSATLTETPNRNKKYKNDLSRAPLSFFLLVPMYLYLLGSEPEAKLVKTEPRKSFQIYILNYRGNKPFPAYFYLKR